MIAARAEQMDTANRLAAIVEGSDDAIVSKDLNGIIVTWNAGAERLFGYAATEIIGKPITILIPPDLHGEEPIILARIRRGERIEHYETVRRRKDGSAVDISLSVSPIKNAAGEIVGASKIARDITERKQAEARLNLMAHEVDHRAKNILATVTALVRMTRADTVATYSKALLGRIRALSNAHSLLAKSRWVGAEIGQIVEEELKPFGDGNVTISGPGDLVLSPEAAQALAMSLHELVTNAAKYGALSVANGSITVEWLINNSQLVLKWAEFGGPPVVAPSLDSFGTILIKTSIQSQLHGEVRFDWRHDGLAVEMRIPTDKLAYPPATNPPSAS
jgi:PAS domain S-box-containing protein